MELNEQFSIIGDPPLMRMPPPSVLSLPSNWQDRMMALAPFMTMAESEALIRRSDSMSVALTLPPKSSPVRVIVSDVI